MCCGCRSAWGCSYCTNRSSRIYSECLGELRRARNSLRSRQCVDPCARACASKATDWNTRRRSAPRAARVFNPDTTGLGGVNPPDCCRGFRERDQKASREKRLKQAKTHWSLHTRMIIKKKTTTLF